MLFNFRLLNPAPFFWSIAVMNDPRVHDPEPRGPHLNLTRHASTGSDHTQRYAPQEQSEPYPMVSDDHASLGWIDVVRNLAGALRSEAASRWWLYGLVGVVIIALTLYWIHSAQEEYRSTLMIGPSDTGITANLSSGMSLPGASNFLGSLSGLAQTNEMTPFQRYPYIQSSLEVADVLARDRDIMQTVFASEWNARMQRWEQSRSSLSPLKDIIKAILRAPAWTPPNGRDLRDFIRKYVRVQPNNIRSVTQVSFVHQDPLFAQNFLAQLHNATIERMKADDRERVLARVDYLVRVLSSTQTVDDREALTQLLTAEHQRQMTLTVDPNYGITVLERPVVGSHPVWPRPFLMIVLGAILGGTLFVVIFIVARQLEAYRPVRTVTRRRKRRPKSTEPRRL